jgi:bifunctional UDP-N-acetylglucosamine pyrophosphorylase / glucosamine-1-phosphate N-acetyltransferase
MAAPASDLHAVILAAGLGTRMKSDVPKVLHAIAGRPLLLWPVALAGGVGVRRTLVVLGHKLEDVRAVLGERAPGQVEIVKQERQLGTGHAVKEALPALASEPDSARVLVLYGDVPLLSPATVTRLVEAQGAAPLALVTARADSPTGYGRIVRDGAGHLARVVEERDASPEERLLREINAGIYLISLGFLREKLATLSSTNAQRELYLTDLAALAAELGVVPTVEAPFEEILGVNDRVDLARMDALARRRVAERWMRAGVTIVAPETVAIDADLPHIGRDVQIGPACALRGATRVGDRVRIDAGCVLTDTVIEDDAVIRPYCVLTEARVGARAQVGPFAHCRPGTVLEPEVHLGNFVETKKARLGHGAKASHLSYLGDADIGPRVNVGAGTITCNYDGERKHTTIIEEGAFIGSDTQLVAPVTVGKGAVVGAGTTVTEPVPPGALAISRTRQVNVEGYVERRRQRRKE